MKKTLKLLIIISIFSLLTVACTPKEKPEVEDQPNLGQEENIDQNQAKNQEEGKGQDKTKQEAGTKDILAKDLAEVKDLIEKEEAVKTVIATSMETDGKEYILIDIEVAIEDKVDDLANKYADMLKEENPDKIVDIKVMKGVETLVQETRE